MGTPSFYDKLQAIQTERGSDLALLLTPQLAKMPLPIARYDDPFLPFGKAIIDATRDLVCGYVFDLAAYLAIGAAGAVALERTIAYAGGDGSTITILHAPFVGTGYVEAVSNRAFNVDAVTLVSDSDVDAYLAEISGVFIMAQERTPVIFGAGIYHPVEHWLRFYERNRPILKTRLVGKSVLYAGSGDDFDQQVRAAVSAERSQR